MTPPPPARPSARQPLSWPVTLKLTAAAVLPALAVYAVAGALMVPAVAAGTVLGLAGTMLGSSRRAAAGGLLVMALMALHQALPALDLRLLAVAPAIAAGWEAARTGGRALPLALMSMGLLVALDHAGAPPARTLPFYAGGLALALPAARALGFHARPKPAPEGLHAGIRQGLFLALGLALAVTIAGHLQSAHAIWVVQFFVLRALAPGHLALPSAAKFFAGVLVGTALAALLEQAGLSVPPLSFAIALAAAVIGLRLLPLGPPYTPAAFTVALLLLTAPTPDAALFRSEAALIASVLAVSLAFGLGRLIRDPGRTSA